MIQRLHSSELSVQIRQKESLANRQFMYHFLIKTWADAVQHYHSPDENRGKRYFSGFTTAVETINSTASNSIANLTTAPTHYEFFNLGTARQSIVTISAFFAVVTASQVPVLWSLGLLDTHRVLQSLVAFGVIFAGLPVGEALAKRMSATVFDWITLALLSLIGLRIIWVALP